MGSKHQFRCITVCFVLSDSSPHNPCAICRDNQDGTWFGATRLVDDYVIPPSFVPSPLQLEADPEDLRLHCTLNIDITLTASTGDVVVTRLRDMCIMVRGWVRGAGVRPVIVRQPAGAGR